MNVDKSVVLRWTVSQLFELHPPMEKLPNIENKQSTDVRKYEYKPKNNRGAKWI